MRFAQDNKIYLASKSPRRRELLRQINVDFELLLLRSQQREESDAVDESVRLGEKSHDYVERISREKAEFAWTCLEKRKLLARPVLTADTTVVLADRILGKPANKAEAAEMLGLLSDKTHRVLTSVVIKKGELLLQKTQASEVTFSRLSADEIDAYCNTLEPYDKAGAYGIQGLAATFICQISGSYSGIVGLPLFETTQLLREAGIIIA